MTTLSSYIIRFRLGFRYSFPALWSIPAALAILAVWSMVVQTVQLVTSPVGWEKQIVLSPPGVSVKDFQFTVRGAMTLVIFEGKRAGESGIFAQISHDGGLNFIEPYPLAVSKALDTGKVPKSPSGAISRDGVTAAVWQDYDESSSRFVLRYSLSRNMGVQWDTPKTAELGTDLALIPRIFFDDENRLHLFFHAYSNESFNLYHSTMEAGGEFTAAVPVARLSREMRGAFFPSFAINGKNIFIVWQGKELVRNRLADDLYFMRSSNYGKSFGSPTRITDSESSDASPFMSIVNNTIYIVYENNENKNWEIRLIRSDDGGDKWTKPLTVSGTNVSAYTPSLVAVSAEELAVFWYDSREVVNRVFTRRYGVSDSRLSKEAALSEGKEGASRPLGAVMGDKILSVWLQGERIRGKFSDAYVAVPVVLSRTHPDGRWVKNPDAVVEWTPPKDESGIVGYASLMSNDPETNPTVQNLSPASRSETLRSLGDGESYYHIRAVDGAGNYSRTVHFPLRISKSPLPIPLIESRTHPERKSVPSHSPIFTWQMSDIVRVKGFMYSLSPNVPSRPRTYTEKMSADFSSLPEGRYFFSVQAIDRTNTPGRIADYEFIVGKAQDLSPEDYKNFTDNRGAEETAHKKPVIKSARIIIEEPSDGAEIPGLFVLRVKADMPRGSVLQRIFYEIIRDGAVVKRGSFEGVSAEIENLPVGAYTLAVKGRFTKDSGKSYAETPIVKRSISIITLPFELPFDMLVRELNEIFGARAALPAAVMFILVVIMSIRSNRRLIFSIERFRDRSGLFFRRCIERVDLYRKGE